MVTFILYDDKERILCYLLKSIQIYANDVNDWVTSPTGVNTAG